MSKSKIRIKSEIINWPTQTTLTARSSTITSAFVHTITPWLIELTAEEEAAIKKIYTDIESKYGLCFNYTESAEDQISAINKGVEILSSNKSYSSEHSLLLKEKIWNCLRK